MKKFNPTGKITVILLAGFLLAYAVVQLYEFIYTPLKTETVISYTVVDYIRATGVAFREETVITGNFSGIISYIYPEGTKVANGTKVAEIYLNPEDALIQKRIREIDREISLLIEAKELGDGYILQSHVIARQISEQVGRLIDLSMNGVVGAAFDVTAELALTINKKHIATGREQDFSQRISELQAERNLLLSRASPALSTICSDQSGYFVKSTDGFENIIKAQNIDDLTVNVLEEYISRANSEFSNQAGIGKIVTDFRWYFAVVMPREDAQRLRLNSTVTIDFKAPNTLPVTAAVYKTEINGNDQNSMVIFSLNIIADEILSVRAENVDIHLRSLTGLRVSGSAIRFLENENGVIERGVYVQKGYEIQFKPVSVIYEERGYILCDPNFGDNPLRRLDEVVIDGIDMYDGKLIE